MIDGFDQYRFLKDFSPEYARKEVKRYFKEAGENGSYIISSSDHFFENDINLIEAFVDETKNVIILNYTTSFY